MQLSENYQQIQRVSDLISPKNGSLSAESSSAFDNILDNIMSDERQSSAVSYVNYYSDTARSATAGTGKLRSESVPTSASETKSSAISENMRSSQNGKQVCDQRNSELKDRVNGNKSYLKDLSENSARNSAESSIKSANRINSDHDGVTAKKDQPSVKSTVFSEHISERKEKSSPAEDVLSLSGGKTESESADSRLIDSAEKEMIQSGAVTESVESSMNYSAGNVIFNADDKSDVCQNISDQISHNDLNVVEENSVYQNELHINDNDMLLKETASVVSSSGYADFHVSSPAPERKNSSDAQKMISAEETSLRHETVKNVPGVTQRIVSSDFEKNIISVQSGTENIAYVNEASEEISDFSPDTPFLKGEHIVGEPAEKPETAPDRYSDRVLHSASNFNSRTEDNLDPDHAWKVNASDVRYGDQLLQGNPYASRISETELSDREELVYSDVKAEEVRREGINRDEVKLENVSVTKTVYDSADKVNIPSSSYDETPEVEVPEVKQPADNVTVHRSDIHRFANQFSSAVNTFSSVNAVRQQNAETVYQSADSSNSVNAADTGSGRVMEDIPETSADGIVNRTGNRSEEFRSSVLQHNAMYREVNFFRRNDIAEEELSEVSSVHSGMSSDTEETDEPAGTDDNPLFTLKGRNSDNVRMPGIGFRTGNVMISSRSTDQSQISLGTAGITSNVISDDSDYTENDEMQADMLPENAEFMNILKSSRDVSARVSQGSAGRLQPEIQNVLSSEPASSVFNMDTDADAAINSSFVEALRSMAAGRNETAAAATSSERDKAGNLKLESEFVQTELSASDVVRQTGSSGFGENAGRNTDDHSAEHISQPHSVSGTNSGNNFKESLNAVQQLQKTVQLSRNYEENAKQIAENINIMLSKNVREAEINLDPTGLGKMKIVINMSEDAMARVSMVVQQNETRELINDSMSRLRSMLEQQGIALEESSVEQQNSWGDRSQNRGSSETKEFTSDKISHDNDDGTGFIAEGAGSADVSEREVDYYA